MKKTNVKRMAGIGLLMALVVVLQFVGAIIPSPGGFNFSLVLIPIVVGSAVFGIRAGMILGATFGVVVFINCTTGFDVSGAMIYDANPLLCFLVVMMKGTLCGAAAGWVYKHLKCRNGYLAMLCAAIVCPIVNTGIFLIALLTVFKAVLSEWAGGGSLLTFIMSVIVLCNFVPELIINIVFSPAGQRITHIVK